MAQRDRLAFAATARASDGRETRLEKVCLGLWRAAPHFSARDVVSPSLAAALIDLALPVVLGAVLAPVAIGAVAYWAACAGFCCTLVVRVASAGVTLSVGRWAHQAAWRADLPRYTILCPMHREARCLPAFAEALRRLDYPADRLDVLLVLEEDDEETIAAAREHAADFGVVLVPAALPRTKPKALNYALAGARGDFVAVYDAEDIPHPRQLRAALDAFAAGGPRLAAVQAPLLIDNGRTHWIARQFEIEYALHFLGLVPLLARLSLPPPLGGTSNHFRIEALRDVGAWDPYNVTEDADLGYRLARRGWRIDVIDPPTFEEAPTTVLAWIGQRSRWLKGYAQTWLVLMRRPSYSCREMGLAAFVSAQVCLLGALASAFVHAPLLAWTAAHWTLHPHHLRWFDLGLLLGGYAAALLGAFTAACARREPALALAGLLTPLYWPLSFAAALRALAELCFRPHHWAKTEHACSTRDTPAIS